jgi:hypothetical protein
MEVAPMADKRIEATSDAGRDGDDLTPDLFLASYPRQIREIANIRTFV